MGIHTQREQPPAAAAAAPLQMWTLLLVACGCVLSGAQSFDTGRNSIVTNATSPVSEGDWVKVSWESDDQNYSSNCWVGLFAPIDTPFPIKSITPDPAVRQYTPPFTEVAPIKFIQCREGVQTGEGAGNFVFHLHNYRSSVFFSLFTGGLHQPLEKQRSSPVLMADLTRPMHLRLSLTRNAGEMLVGWTSSDPAASLVKYGCGAEASSLKKQVKAHSISTFGPADLCGPPANADGFFDPAFAFYATIPATSDPSGGNTCSYMVGSNTSGWSAIHHFMQQPTELTRILLTADVGATEVDGSHYHWEEPNASNTYRGLSSHKSDAALTLHVGDLSYATGYESKWENFMAQIEPLSSSMPYMVAHGNHERDWPGTGTIGGTDSGGECGVATRHRFRMPTPTPDNTDRLWYSFNVGPGPLVHVIVIDTEVAVSPGSDQHTFISDDLKKVNRTQTPWVIVAGHRPMYYGNPKGYTRDPHFADALESMFVTGGVDLCLWGHVHNLMATCAVNNGTCVAPDASTGHNNAPVHVVIGNGGMSLTKYDSKIDPPEWVHYKRADYGWNEIVVTDSELSVLMHADNNEDTLYHTVTLKSSARRND